jgi:hypothetical protein
VIYIIGLLSSSHLLNSHINVQAVLCAFVSPDVNRKATVQKEADIVWNVARS